MIKALVTWSRRPRIFIFFYQVQIALFDIENVSITISAKYLDYINVVFSDFTSELLKHIGLLFQFAHQCFYMVHP